MDMTEIIGVEQLRKIVDFLDGRPLFRSYVTYAYRTLHDIHVLLSVKHPSRLIGISSSRDTFPIWRQK